MCVYIIVKDEEEKRNGDKAVGSGVYLQPSVEALGACEQILNFS
jgi:hypothetical protein